jgi:hypothetical protein
MIGPAFLLFLPLRRRQDVDDGKHITDQHHTLFFVLQIQVYTQVFCLKSML